MWSRSAAALVVATLPFALVATATADDRPTSVTVRDDVGDVWATPVGGDAFAPAPEQRIGDVKAMRVTHQTRTVVVRLRFAELARTGSATYELDLRLPDRRVSAQVATDRRSPTGRHALWSSRGDRLRCPGMSHLVDSDRDVIVVRIPRSCLGAPAWVRVRNYDLRERAGTLFTDNPHNREAHADRWAPRAYRP